MDKILQLMVRILFYVFIVNVQMNYGETGYIMYGKLDICSIIRSVWIIRETCFYNSNQMENFKVKLKGEIIS